MEKQLFLPGFRLSDVSIEAPIRIVRYIQECKGLLAALGIGRAETMNVLARPQRHWQRIVVHQGNKDRVCFRPSPMLRKIHRRLWRFLRNLKSTEQVAAWHEAVNMRRYATWMTLQLIAPQAFWRGSSIVKNARLHQRNQSSWVIDLQDAFAGIRTKHIQRFLERTLKHKYECERLVRPPSTCYAHSAAWVISRLVTFEGRLRQGSRVAPFLFNLLMERFDITLAGEIGSPIFYGQQSSSGIVYTRYGDDLCFSSPEKIFPHEVKAKIQAIVDQHDLRLNNRKQREGHDGIMEFPGVVVVRGMVRPRQAYLEQLAQKLAAGNLSARQHQGHVAFLSQFQRRSTYPGLSLKVKKRYMI